MAMSWIWGLIVIFSFIYAAVSGNLNALGASVTEGASAAAELCVGIAGVTCLWCGIMEVMRRAGITDALSRLVSPLLLRLFPSAGHDRELAGTLSAGFAANFLGLGNAATPLGIKSASLMYEGDGRATDEMCLLIVMNTASVQLIPATVAAVRSAAGSAAPFDILPAVWLTSLCSVTAGIAASRILKRVWR